MNKRQVKSKLDFEKCVKESRYKQIGDYINTSTKVKLLCPNNHIYLVNPSHFKNGVRCPKCQELSKEYAENKFFKMVLKENYITFGEYKNNKSKLDFECPEGHKFSMRPNDFMTGHRCKICSQINCKGSVEKREKTFKKLKIIAEQRNYTILGEYKTTQNKIKMQCPKGHIHEYNISHFFNNHNCPVCNANSKAEIEVYKLLENNNINFEFQKSFINLKGVNGGLLRFDFYFPETNSVIEIQGEQHYNSVKFFKNNDKYYKYKQHDLIKKKYCIQNNITLYTIPYLPIKSHLNISLENVIKSIQNLIDKKSI